MKKAAPSCSPSPTLVVKSTPSCGGEINTIMVEAMDRVGLGEVQAADVMPDANAEVNALFQ